MKINKGDVITISSEIEARPLLLELTKLILKKGALPKINLGLDGYAYTFYKYASLDQLATPPKIALFEAENSAGNISIGVDNNTRELSNIDPAKMALRRKTVYPVSKIIVDRDNWCYTLFPTHALAQDAEMSLNEFEDFYYNAVLVDYKKLEAQQKKIKKIYDASSSVHIVAKDTDLRFSIKGREGIMCVGKRNLPDGEVFLAPVEDSVEGYISYSFPAIYSGREVDGVRLEFKKGKVVKASATKNQDLLLKLIDTDAGSRFLGEFAIGLNNNIKKHSKQILFDEKMGGTIHLALGMAYKKGGGRNESALHWDMIKDMRPAASGGKIFFDDKLVYQDGKFVVKI